ncbi:phage tail protein [Sporomusa sp. KB1]|jgi:microcystin-dependent protein|uniref:phage tail protein n=1 Tax=Sporomusa sp. KB1 TaxID=943346 RepID=UPI0011A2D99C|nr:tail fiber protein [Sporomusa sp. KB1]TWH48799.1 microcystin-dependent protein [Sporomusa sp. KB1]
MSDPYIGEIRLFAGNYAPENWALCNGSLLSISQYEALYALIGTTYGGDGVTNFAIPDLRGRLPIHMGTYTVQGDTTVTYPIGSTDGAETAAVTADQMPVHTHTACGQSVTGTQPGPGGNVWAAPSSAGVAVNQYLTDLSGITLKSMDANSIQSTGGSQVHNNVMPGIVLNYIIALVGLWPDKP